jgi:VWFA-related protein
VFVVAAFLAIGARQMPQDPPRFRAAVAAIPVYATVRSDDGALVPDLTAEDFEIRDNGVVRDLTQFSREIVPITVTVMLDMSGSQETGAGWMRDAGRAFVDALLPGDRARIGTFGDEIAISPRLTGDKRYLFRVLNEEIWPGYNITPLWDALDRAMTSLAGEPGRRVVLVLTDGVDYGGPGTSGAGMSAPSTLSMFDASDGGPALSPFGAEKLTPRRVVTSSIPGSPLPVRLRERAARESFMVYAVGRQLDPTTLSRNDPRGAVTLPLNAAALTEAIRDLAVDSGGGYRVYAARANAATAMAQVAEELHHQYLLGFTPTAMDGKVHKIEIKARGGGLSVQARKSYLAIE